MSGDWRILRNTETGKVVLERAYWCSSYWCHFRGLQLVRHLPENEGLLFVYDREGRTSTAIHMLFMFFSIGVLWLNKDGQVVDKKLAKPWRISYVPDAPAQYFIEANISILERVEIGDTLRFDEETP